MKIISVALLLYQAWDRHCQSANSGGLWGDFKLSSDTNIAGAQAWENDTIKDMRK